MANVGGPGMLSEPGTAKTKSIEPSAKRKYKTKSKKQ